VHLAVPGEGDAEGTEVHAVEYDLLGFSGGVPDRQWPLDPPSHPVDDRPAGSLVRGDVGVVRFGWCALRPLATIRGGHGQS
jgi:hypothetical protein